MNFLDKVKDTVSATGVSQKVSYTTSTMKLNNMIKANQKEIERISFEIGKDYVQRHLQDTDTEYESQLDTVRHLQAEINDIYQEIERLRIEQEQARQRAQEEKEARALARQQEIERQRQIAAYQQEAARQQQMAAYQQQIEYQQQMAAYQQQAGYQPPVAKKPEVAPPQTVAPQQPAVDDGVQAVPAAEPTSSMETAAKFCTKCGGENDLDSRFCVHCGNSF